MRNKHGVSRKKVVWGYSIVLKHLKWYIETSEVISNNEKGPLLESLTDAHKQVVRADRIEDRYRNEERGQIETWFNNRRAAEGKKLWKERRLVDELIRAILEK